MSGERIPVEIPQPLKHEIEPEQTHGLLLFRLTESVDLVIIHRRVKEALEKAGTPTTSLCKRSRPPRVKVYAL